MRKKQQAWLFFILLLAACNYFEERKFTKTAWLTKEEFTFPYRDKILTDLTQNYRLKGISYAQLVQLLGQPQYTDSTSVGYEITVVFAMTEPNYIKNLNLDFNKDSIITAYKIDEWKR